MDIMKMNVADRMRQLYRFSSEVKLAAKWRSTDYLPGSHRSAKTGPTGNLEVETRKYRPGDKLSSMKWKALAKNPDKPMVRLFERHTRIPVVVLMDVSARMDYGTQALSKRELGAALVLSVMRSAAFTGDQSRFAAYSEEGIETAFPRGAGQLDSPMNLRLKATRAALSTPVARPVNQDTSVSPLQRALNQLPTFKSLVYIISDFETLTREDEAALRKATRHHEVVCCKVNDLREFRVSDVKPLWWPVSVETSEGPQTIFRRRAYEKRFDDHEQVVLAMTSRLRWKFAKFTTDEESSVTRRRFRRISSSKRQRLNLMITRTNNTPTTERGTS